ncbi:triokinase/FMN cyclase-like isoform X1 [Asterias amurensis]|uniref:triokinase/FMN cyclase-like isoform X1 n=1 Tax=Asterias amurensis TaxID=7602 RepID=UPI003AB21FAE
MARHHKQFLNSVGTCVDEMLEGVVALNPCVKKLKGHRVILRGDVEEYRQTSRVAVLSGGGSGHEPFAAGYVGQGMLTGAIAGSVFTSPPASDIFTAIKAVANPAGVLLIVANYTGDRINFGIAAEKARSRGIHVETVTVAEDCALTSVDKTAGRRGLCGIILVQKIAGALAEEGHCLEEIVEVTAKAVKHMGTIGISLSPCHVPGSGATFQIPDDEMELGLGVHGEPGVKRIKVCQADSITAIMIDHMTSSSTNSHIDIKSGDNVMIVLNNLGGTSSLELCLMSRSIINYLESKGVVVERVMVGHFMTSLDMAGFSLTIMHLDEQRIACIDSATNAMSWHCQDSLVRYKNHGQPRGHGFVECQADSQEQIVTKRNEETSQDNVKQGSSTRLLKVVVSICESLIASEDRLNELDRSGGDGDCGSTMKRGAEAILSSRDSLVAMGTAEMIGALAGIVGESMGGSSGGLYTLFLTAASRRLQSHPEATHWVDALDAGIQAVCRYGGAEPGDRTMLDPLHAALATLKPAQSKQEVLDISHFRQAVEAAEDKAVETGLMEARAGRASYVNRDLVKGVDPGAQAVAIWLRAACRAYDVD